ncbi:hypothetical protein WJM97_08795 [Okeanomitos corallinicola TIOX110]|uniref:Uncharacterized protein n=1 Tax=Okeanomitos corallinicola TIOX110 TaxID=3133117 RepID=A0ABZ2UXH1_9CYAN
MNLNIIDDCLQIEFTFTEQLLAARLHKSWQIPLTNIIQVTTELPPNTWKEIRAPGTAIPGVIKTGTYYTDRGKEFWYVRRKNNFGNVLNIQLANESYQRIVLNNIENNDEWQQKLIPTKS